MNDKHFDGVLSEKIEQMKKDNRLIVRRLLREIAAVNIQNPYFGRIEAILYEAVGLEKEKE